MNSISLARQKENPVDKAKEDSGPRTPGTSIELCCHHGYFYWRFTRLLGKDQNKRKYNEREEKKIEIEAGEQRRCQFSRVTFLLVE